MVVSAMSSGWLNDALRQEELGSVFRGVLLFHINTSSR